MEWDNFIDRNHTGCNKWDAVREEGVIPMWIADMDFLSPKAVQQAIIERAEHNCYGYPYHSDIELRNTISQWLFKRFTVSLSSDNMFPIAGVVTALFHCVETLTNIGDKIVVQSPVYPPLFQVVINQNRQIVFNQLIEKDGYYSIDFDDFENKIKTAKLFLLCNPHNPVGRSYTIQELTKMAEICLKYNVLIVSDEIHHDIVFTKHIPIFSLSPEISQQTITLMSPSKTFNIAGLFTSFMGTENKDLLQKLYLALKKKYAHHINIFGITATKAAYTYGEQWLDSLLPYLKDNAFYIHDFLNKNIPDLSMNIPEATYLGWIDFRKLQLSSVELDDFLLKKAKLWLTNGSVFGDGGEGFARINYACPRTTLEKAMNNLLQAY